MPQALQPTRYILFSDPSRHMDRTDASPQRFIALQDCKGQWAGRNEHNISSDASEHSEGDEDSISDEGDEDIISDEEDSGTSSPEASNSDENERDEASHRPSSQAQNKQAEDEDSPRLYTHITISRDHTAANAYHSVDLLVSLSNGQEKDKQNENLEFDLNPAYPLAARDAFDNFDFESFLHDNGLIAHPLMLPEQENMKRLMVAKLERQDQEEIVNLKSGADDLDTAGPSYTANQAVATEVPASTALSVQEIEREIRALQQLQRRLFSTTCKVLYKIQKDESTFLTEPSWVGGSKGTIGLRGNSPIADEAAFLRQRPEIAFVVYRYYNSDHQAKEIQEARDAGTALPKPAHYRESIMVVSEPLAAALDMFLNSQASFKTDFPAWDPKVPIESPFLFWYYYRSNLTLGMMEEPHKSQMSLLATWLHHNYDHVYASAETLFAQGLVSEPTMPFFVRPGEVVVSKGNQAILGHIAVSWSLRPYDTPTKTKSWKASVWSYGFDGCFHEVQTNLYVTPKFDEAHKTVEIAQLEVLPLRLASSEFRTTLERRGQIMWNCRYSSLVAYENDGDGDLFGKGERYMVDLQTYKQLHLGGKSKHIYSNTNAERKEMPATAMEAAEPPRGPKGLVFPSTITGYNLRRKTWQDLVVDRIHSVSWNKEAFQHLVIDPDSKDLIEALIVTKLETDQGTDLIQGKGNGLIMLLHGGPGTGKTFTAESVAEFAEKPLFRVTCGDIGTEPEKVEKYLESVLHLGKIWGCVVLLDEADVFLEQRTLTDLQRNALVSVFLRILEYYEGILILTSNRVGTFDEAFKSRIQLSLHYEPLSRTQRHKIWKNFFQRLRQFDGAASTARKGKGPTDSAPKPLGGPRMCERADDDGAGIDFDDIECFLSELAEKKMNGRQIRNAITTARQLARFKKTKMSSVHLRNVIRVSEKFDEYLKTVQDGHTDDQIAREDGIR